MWMPISLRRSLTVYDRIPYVPIAASSSASPANSPSSCARNRGRATDSENTSSIVRSRTMGSVGSIVPTICRMFVASDSTGSADLMTMFMFDGAKLVSRPCSAMKYNSVPVLLPTPPCFTSRTTPTIVNQGFLGLNPTRNRLPIGLRSL